MSTNTVKVKTPRKLPRPGKRLEFKAAQAKIIKRFNGAFRRLAQ